MKKKFTAFLSLFMLAGLLIIVAGIYVFQGFTAKKNERANFNEKLNSIETRLQENDAQVKDLTNNLGQNALAKTKAFAELINENPDIIESKEKLAALCEKLDVAELHVIDPDGVLRHGTVEDYYGLDFADGDQTRPFLDILKDPTMQIVQEPQPNAANGTLLQYIAVSRIDKPGIVQAAIRPEVLENMLASNTIQNVLSNIEVGTTGYAFALNKTDGTIEAFPEESYIGKSSAQAGLPDKILNSPTTEATGTINGKKVYYITREYENYILGVAVEVKELYQERNRTTAMFMICILFIFICLIMIIRNLLAKIVVNDIALVIDKLALIRSGDLEVTVDIKSCREMEQLSGSINEMVGSIKRSIEQNNKKALENEGLLKQQENLFKDVKEASVRVSDFSEKTYSIADEINQGTMEQSKHLDELQVVMKELINQSRESARVSESTAKTAYEAVEKMETANRNMQDMMKAMEQIADTSEKIEEIIANIDGIATQTNMLALNASIEAARAGEQGKGFAVVADQVGVLANQSTHAAKETDELIKNSLEAIRRGGEMARKATETFLQVVDDSKNTGKAIEGLLKKSKEQAEVVEQAEAGILEVVHVVENNAAISKASAEASGELAKQAEILKELVQK